jgi:methylenetetrahydrofolate--tRNA-(uracil-5-)-methyltransferase
MAELRQLTSLLLACAEERSVPAGGALAVDRSAFSQLVSERIESHPRIHVIREEVQRIPEGKCVIASGPLTSESLSRALATRLAADHLFFYDALSPIVAADSIDMSIAYRASRYSRGQSEAGDYINCPFDKDAYANFVAALLDAERIPLREFEEGIRAGVRAGVGQYFEGCLPVEVIATRGHDALAFGPMRPVGLRDPRTNRRPHAVVQLRQDDQAASLYNLVGFQTNLTYPEQRRVFRLIPGLGEARFVRYGQMHRNTFINAPELLQPTLQFRRDENLFFAGQITGVEGYLGNVATGLLAGINIARLCQEEDPIQFPHTTMLGALCHYITHAEPKRFQPMKANFGIMPPLDDGVRRNRRQRAQAYADRSARDLSSLLDRL